MSETAMRVECTECGGSGHGPDRCDGPGDVYQDKCGRCDGRGLEPAGKTDALAVVVTDLEPESALAIGLVDLSLLDRARVVLAASGPDPMPVVRAALRFVEHCTPALEGSAWFEATREFIDAVDAYRKAGGTP